MRAPLRRLVRALVLALPLAAAALPQLAAQERRGIVEVGRSGRAGDRGGFWINGGLGAGGLATDLEGDGRGFSDVLYRPTVSLRLGGTPSQFVRLGGEFTAWINRDNEFQLTETVSSALFTAQLYPLRRAGLFVKGGAGLGIASVREDGFFDSTEDVGFAWAAGVGYEIPIGRNLALVPIAEYHYHIHDGRAGTGFNERILNFGLSFQWQSGRRR